MGISFAGLQWSYVIFVDWVEALKWLNRRLRLGPVTVLYDPHCKLCRRVMSVLVSFDWSSQIRAVPNTRLEELRGPAERAVSASGPELPFLVIDDQAIATAGYLAYRQIASRIPILWPFRALMSLPAVESAGLRIYGRIAGSRTCSIAAAPDNLEASARRTQTWPAAQIQVLLIAAFFLAGVTHNVDAWPVACFPTFDSIPRPLIEKLSMQSIDRRGSIKDETLSFDSRMGALLGTERWAGLTDHFMSRPSRPRGAIALLRLWQKNHKETPTRSARFSADMYAVNMSTGAQTLIKRRLLGTVSTGDGT